MAELHRQIGKLKVKNDFFSQLSRSELGRAQKQQVIAMGHPEVSIQRQCQLFGLLRSNYYRGLAFGLRIGDLELMSRIDELYIEHSWMGSCTFVGHLTIPLLPSSRGEGIVFAA